MARPLFRPHLMQPAQLVGLITMGLCTPPFIRFDPTELTSPEAPAPSSLEGRQSSISSGVPPSSRLLSSHQRRTRVCSIRTCLMKTIEPIRKLQLALSGSQRYLGVAEL